MTIRDIRTSASGSSFETDVCVVGAGPAGLSLALQFADTATRVVVLESGGLTREADVETLNEIESVGLRRAPQDVTRCRGLGGTSALWSGRCAVLDDTDFQARPWIPDSGWPINYDDVEPFVDRASSMLGLGPALYTRAQRGPLHLNSGAPAWDGDTFVPLVFQASQHTSGDQTAVRAFAEAGVDGAENIGVLQHAGAPKPRHLGEYYRQSLQAAKNIDVLLHANVAEIETDEAGKVAVSLRVRTLTGEAYQVRASQIVLACGGIDNARLLLASRSRNDRGVGNTHDTVGRYLMDHPFATLSTYTGDGSRPLRRRLGSNWFDRDGIRHVFTQGLRLHPELQRKHGLLNCAVHMVEFGDGAPPVGQLGSALRLAKRRQFDGEFWRYLGAATADPAGLAAGVADRYVHRRPALTKPTSVVFGGVVEQLPDRNSRVLLSDELDALGMPRAKIDWRASDLEFETAAFLANSLHKEFKRLGYAAPIAGEWIKQGADAYRRMIHDMAHPMGSTRMSSDASRGVVDENCMVHGVENLFVAGSSTFTTSGYVNPTLMIVSLSLRLADHLKARLEQPVIETGSRASGTPPVRSRARVGLVGAGDRMRRFYTPVLKGLADRFEVVGVTSRTAGSSSKVAESFAAPAFASAEELVQSVSPDFLVVAVPDALVEETFGRLIPIGVPLLVETPFCWNVGNGRKNLQSIKQRNLLVGIAEQTPFLPLELFKQHLIELGLIGKVETVRNDFEVYAYHGVAALRAYLGSDRRAQRVSTVRLTQDGAEPPSFVQGRIAYDDGAVACHAIGDPPGRFATALTVTGSAGSISNDAVVTTGADGQPQRCEIKAHRNDDGSLVAFSADTPLGELRWENPYAKLGLSDEHCAVARVLDGMANAVHFGGWPLYDGERALQDMELLTAMRYSEAIGGRPVSLPIRPRYDAIRGKIWSRVKGRL